MGFGSKDKFMEPNRERAKIHICNTVTENVKQQVLKCLDECDDISKGTESERLDFISKNIYVLVVLIVVHV